ncbi:MAG: T9SS type A sorting domain-containing protein [Ignavibacteria bacterium]
MQRKTIFQFLIAAVLVISLAYGFFSLSNDKPTTASDFMVFGTPDVVNHQSVNTDAIGTWSQGANVILSRYHGQGTSYSRNDTGWLYFIGGDINGSGTLTNANHRYNINTNTWTAMATLPTVVWYSCAATLGNFVYVGPGLTSAAFNSANNVLQRYSINADSWATMAPLPIVTGMSKLVGYQDSLLYLTGGFIGGGTPGGTHVYLYNATSNTWRTCTPMPAPRCGHAAAITGDTLVVIGGATSYSTGITSIVYRGVISQADRSVITWTTGAPLPVVSHRLDAQNFFCKGIITSPGSQAGFTPTNTCYSYLGNVWTNLPNITMQTSAAHTGAVRFSNNLVKFVVASGLILQVPFSIPNTQIYTDTCAPSGPQVSRICRNGLNKPILDHQTTRDTITFNLGPTARILDVNITIDTVTHTWDSDLRFYMAHLTTGVRFINNVGGSGDNFIGTNINDSGACAIGASGCNTPPFTGTFRPTAPANLLGFNNQSPNLIWVLSITDTFDADVGVLKAWCITILWDNLVAAGNNNNIVPNSYALNQNYPNPFNPSTKISFQLPKADNVKLVVFDILGREVKTLVNDEFKQAGSHTVDFNASGLSSGVYFYKIETKEFTDTKRMMLIK